MTSTGPGEEIESNGLSLINEHRARCRKRDFLRSISGCTETNRGPYCGRGRRTGTTALTAALLAIAVPSLTSSAQAWRGWRGGLRGAAVGAAVVGSAIAARSYYGYGYGYPAYGYGTGYGYHAYGYGYGTGFGYAANSYAPAYTGYSYPAYGYGYGTGYSYPANMYGYRPGIVRRGLYAAAWRRWR